MLIITCNQAVIFLWSSYVLIQGLRVDLYVRSVSVSACLYVCMSLCLHVFMSACLCVCVCVLIEIIRVEGYSIEDLIGIIKVGG